MESSVADFAVECIPVVGTLKQGYEFIQALNDGDTNRAFEKGVGACVSLCFDLLGGKALLAGANAGVKAGVAASKFGVCLVAKETIKEVIKEKIVKEGGKKFTTRVVARNVSREIGIYMSERFVCQLAAKGVCHCALCEHNQKTQQAA